MVMILTGARLAAVALLLLAAPLAVHAQPAGKIYGTDCRRFSRGGTTWRRVA
jgi:hypothetical protein